MITCVESCVVVAVVSFVGRVKYNVGQSEQGNK